MKNINNNSVAFLSHSGEYSKFSFGDRTISFLTSRNLEKYTRILDWDEGYLVVMSKNFGKEEQEDYIDLVPILKNLYFDPQTFLAPIKEVKIRYE